MLHPSSICGVCGSTPASKNFDAITCASCKVFFRRNGHRDLSKERCRFNKICNIREDNRRRCGHCRLLKCLAIGMNRELFRSSHRNNISAHQLRKETIYPLDLLQDDRSALTTDQWTLLSNAVNMYNTRCPIDDVGKFLIVSSALPVKLRMKFIAANYMNSVSSVFVQVIRFIESIVHFKNLPSNVRTALIKRHAPALGGFHGLLVARELNLYSNPEYKACTVRNYGEEVAQRFPKDVNRLDRDDTLARLLIIILAFSPCDTIDYSVDDCCDPSQRSLAIFVIQNLYVETMFKYMIFRYGYLQASSRFVRLIKIVLDQSLRLETVRTIAPHREMIIEVTRR